MTSTIKSLLIRLQISNLKSKENIS